MSTEITKLGNGLNVVTMARTAGLMTPFVVITAFPDDGLRHSIDLVDDAWVLEKPFRARDLIAIIMAVTNGSHHRHAG